MKNLFSWRASYNVIAVIIFGFCLIGGVIYLVLSGYNQPLFAGYAERVRAMQSEYEEAPDVCKPGLARVISLHPAEVSISYLDEELRQFVLQIRDQVNREKAIISPNSTNP